MLHRITMYMEMFIEWFDHLIFGKSVDTEIRFVPKRICFFDSIRFGFNVDIQSKL